MSTARDESPPTPTADATQGAGKHADLHLSEARYRTLFEHAPIGILYADAQSNYIDANDCMCRMLGYTRDELIGLNARHIVSPTEADHTQPALDDIHAQTNHRRDWLFRRKDGSTFTGEVVATKFPDGTLLGMIQDVTELKKHEHELARMTRLYDALSQINQAIVWTPTREELFAKVCRTLVEHGGFSMAWIGWHDAQTQRIMPVAEHGDENGYLQSVRVYADDRPEGQGPSGIAFRSGRPYISNDLLADDATTPWRDELQRRGFFASAALPIRLDGRVCGTLSVYADQRDFFHDKEIALLEEAATDVSFALDNFARDEARIEADRTLRSEKKFVDTMIESMPGILYFYDAAGRFLRWNRNFEAVSGYSGEEISRMHPLDFFTGEDRARVEQRIAKVFTTGGSSVEAPFVTRDGSVIPYFFTGRLVEFEGKSCLVGVGIDISETRLAQDRLMESERKYRELVENANSIILRWSSEGYITFLNEFGQKFFGYAADEIVGRHVMGTIVPPTESGGRDLAQLVEDILAAPEVFEQIVNENMHRNGERVWIAWTNRIVRDAEGRIVEFLSIGTDITQRRRAELELKRAESELRELNESLEQKVAERTEELQAALVRAEAADRLKSTFLATMSHELRTPLNSIIGFTGIILQGLAGPLNEEQNKQMKMVQGSARHLLALVNDVLDISKIEAGQLEVSREPFDLGTSIANVLALITPQVEAKRLKLHTSIPPQLGQAISDERRFEQILLNLLSNAIKFTNMGEIRLTAEMIDDFRTSDAAPAQRAIRLRVSDTGIGIKPEDLASLFQPFRQIDSALSRHHEGTGLGLAICRRLAHLMGGEITAESVWGKGSTFSVTLPIRNRVNS